MSDPQLTHLDDRGQAHMVDVGAKPETLREAVAVGWVLLQPATLAAMVDGTLPKGDVFATARLAGIMAAKRTADLIPLCHPLALTSVAVELEPVAQVADDPRLAHAPGQPAAGIRIQATARVTGRTGVEMEALTAVSGAALTLYDMGKAVDRGMVLTGIRLLAKSGGRSGEWRAEEESGTAA